MHPSVMEVGSADLADWALDTGIWVGVIVLGVVAAFFAITLGARRLIHRGVRWVDDHVNWFSLSERQARAITWFFALVLIGLVLLGGVLALLDILDVDVSPATDVLRDIGAAIGTWFGTNGLRVSLIVLLAYVAYQVVKRLVPGFLEATLVQKKESEVEQEEAKKRADTLTTVIVRASGFLLSLIALFTVLPEFGINIGPILASVGIVGIAIGFGGQYLVRDIISGIFILLEDQYRRGDVASVGGKTGLVEEVNLRRTILRDLDGIVHIIPNGEIGVSSNYTKTFSRLNLDIGVAYKEDLDKVFGVLNRVGEEMAKDDYYGPLILEAPRVLRVNDFADSAIMIKMLGVTKPIRQWEVTGELRRRIKKAFDEEGIEIPVPHRTVYWGEGAHPREGPPVGVHKGSGDGAAQEAPEAAPQPSEAALMPEEDDG